MIEQIEEQKPDERGLVLEFGGRYIDRDSGEVIDLDLPDGLLDAAKAVMRRYAFTDQEIAHAKERKAYWSLRLSQLERRRTWFDSWLKPSITAFAKSVGGKVIELGVGTVKLSESKTGSIEVPNRKDEKDRSVEWARVHCKRAVKREIVYKVAIKDLTPKARGMLFSDPEKARMNGFDCELPGERVTIITGGKS